MIAWESAGSAGFKGSRKSTPFAAQVTADSCARKGMEHGLQKVEVFVKGPGSGRETAIRSLQAAGLEILGVKDVSPQAHNGVPPAQAEAGLVARDLGPEVPPLPPRGHEALPQGRALPDGEVRDRAPQLPAGRARPRPHQAERVPAPAAREAEGAPLLRPAREAVPQHYEKATKGSGITGEKLLRMLETRLDNVVYRLGFAGSRAQARQLVRHGHFHVNGRRVNIPSYQVKPNDIVTLKPGSSAEPRRSATPPTSPPRSLPGSRPTTRVSPARC